MKIDRIRLRGVTTHADTTLDLPDAGVVLVTGDNGSGKSSIVEGVPLCLWGKTLRGAVVWSGGDSKSSVEVDAAGTTYTRKAKGRVRFGWTDAPTFETTKAAQAAFEDAHGPLSHWRRACVLSTADAANFTTATDAERKRLLEALTGAEKLEAGYRVALDRAREKRRSVDAAAREVAILEERVAGIRQRLADAVPADVPEAVEVDDGRLSELRGALRETETDVRNARDQIREAHRASDAATMESAAAERERRRIDHDECPTCGQSIPDTIKEAATRLVLEAQEKANAVAVEVEERVNDLEADLADLTAEQRDLAAEIAKMEAEKIEARSIERERARLAKLDEVRAKATADLAAANAELVTARQKLADDEHEARTLEAAAKVLSTKGVRAHLLARTIAAVEAAANAWLGEICDDRIKLNLKPYGETKKGGIKDAVALSIAMTAQGSLLADDDDESLPPRDYASASGGERRRIDVALCFALAEVAEASRGEQGSTIFADEIFDALDTEGRSRVAKALAKLAEDRCVVVIAHEAALDVRTVAAQHWHVVDGKIGRV